MGLLLKEQTPDRFLVTFSVAFFYVRYLLRAVEIYRPPKLLSRRRLLTVHQEEFTEALPTWLIED